MHVPQLSAVVLEWDHNAYYYRLLLRQMPQRCRRVLDVGCGAGTFSAQLAQRSEQVDTLDRSAEMIEEAKRRTPDNVNCVLADVLRSGSRSDRLDLAGVSDDLDAGRLFLLVRWASVARLCV